LGRYIIETTTNEIVWQYILGRQYSEQYRVFEDYGVGEYFECYDGNTDLLILKQSDIEKLERILLETTENDFYRMINSYVKFMNDNSNIKEFYFEGDI
jgi:hypothetical protein